MIPPLPEIARLFREGKDTRDIAEIFNCTEADVYNRLSLAWALKKAKAA
jgi:hypothetical protein